MTRCFEPNLDPRLLDREPFRFSHRLMEHPALSLDNLGRVLPALPKEQVFYSRSTRDTGEDLDRLHENNRNGLSIEETIENIRGADSYIMVRSPETDASFGSLHRALLEEVSALMRLNGRSGGVRESMLYLFIASPNSVTPFHIDRYSTLLLQFRGSKTVTIYPAWDPRVADQQACEDYVAYAAPRGPRRHPGGEALGTAFSFSPGEALHIPFVAGHQVENGPDDVSISMSIIFQTAETERLRKAMMFNRQARKALSRFGLQPSVVGQAPWRDAIKAVAYSGARRTARLLGSR